MAQGQTELVNAYAWLPRQLSSTNVQYTLNQITPTAGMNYISPQGTADTLSRNYWHGYFWGPPGWTGMRPLAYLTGQCRVANGPNQCLDGACKTAGQSQCNATVLISVNAKLTAEICWNGIDDNGRSLIKLLLSSAYMKRGGVLH